MTVPRETNMPLQGHRFEMFRQEEVRSVSSTGAEKGVKRARHSLIPGVALEMVAEHYAAGAEKYEKHNWRKGYEWTKSIDSLTRHLHAFGEGQNLDPETKTPHMAAVAFHALTLLTFMVEHPEFDDRYKPDKPTKRVSPGSFEDDGPPD